MTHSFQGQVIALGAHKIIRIPQDISNHFPSRGMVMVRLTINGIPFEEALEPDGKKGHWLDVRPEHAHALDIEGQHVHDLSLEVIEVIKEPPMPNDVLEAFEKAHVMDMWEKTTPKAKWEWFRWIRATKNPSTRRQRIDVACSKFKKGDKRPCCFDSSRCSVPEVSKSGVLLEEAIRLSIDYE